jgi:hypothetical protein
LLSGTCRAIESIWLGDCNMAVGIADWILSSELIEFAEGFYHNSLSTMQCFI